jgi:hypothetical protein
MFGVPLDGPANAFCDNQSSVLNYTLPLSTLKKKYYSVNYHKVRSCIAAGTIRVTKEPLSLLLGGSDKFPANCPNATRSSLIGQSGIRIA